MPSKEFNRICAFGFFSQIYICIDHYTSSPKSKHFIAKKLKKKKKVKQTIYELYNCHQENITP